MQSNPLKTGRQRAAAMLFLCGILLAPGLRAQTKTTSSSTQEAEAQPNFIKRFSVGLRASILVLDILPSVTTANTPNSLTAVSQALSSTTPRLGGGVTLEYAATPKILVSADLLFHYFSYSAETVTNVTLADFTSQLTTLDERTHARYYDLPILVRYSTRASRIASARGFIGGGVSLRKASNIRTSAVLNNADGTVTVNNTPRALLNRVAYGVEATAGFRLRDDFGIKITPEVRYIRWMSNLFEGWPAQQRKNELQIVLGITF